MHRRRFIALLGGAIALPCVAAAQQRAMPVIGYLSYFGNRPDSPQMVAFRVGLGEAGYVEGQNVVIEYRGAQGHVNRLSALAADLVASHVNVIVAVGGHLTALAAKNETSDTPIVFITGSDPVKDGLVASLARPAGNLTGVTTISSELNPKRLELLSDLVPEAKVIALLVSGRTGVIQNMQEAARAKGLQLLVAEAQTKSEIDTAFARIAGAHAEALVVSDSVLFSLEREHVIALASHYGVPAIYHWPEFAAAGGLLSYGASVAFAFRQIGAYAGRILKGEKPSDLPVQQPVRFELVVNLKTATALGLTVPPSILARADEVIE
jgi:putative tryptophan/tyrosine transport system substrate-binding protein